MHVLELLLCVVSLHHCVSWPLRRLRKKINKLNEIIIMGFLFQDNKTRHNLNHFLSLLLLVLISDSQQTLHQPFSFSKMRIVKQ